MIVLRILSFQLSCQWYFQIFIFIFFDNIKSLIYAIWLNILNYIFNIISTIFIFNFIYFLMHCEGTSWWWSYGSIQLFNGCGCNRPNYLSFGAGNDQVFYCIRFNSSILDVNVDLHIGKIPRYKHHLNHMWDFQRDPS